MVAVVISFSRNRHGEFVAVLDNGQVWVEADGSTLRADIKPGTGAILEKRPVAGYALYKPGVKQPAFVKRLR